MTFKHIFEAASFWILVFALVLGFSDYGSAQTSKKSPVNQSGGDITILVTAMPSNDTNKQDRRQANPRRF